ncbi:MAG TPA: carboxypeptidase regulatory-like domain-containing protein [Candidatus Angelobacter sp.]|nr:carboxypeptidase regulatory-like domain-containing protein [Candidatus Angelobacter sp.]
MRHIRLVTALGSFLLFCSTAWGQGGATGAISGTVQDPSGAVIAGAKVRAVNEATSEHVRETVSDSGGLFTLTLLPVGAYTVEVSAAGFADTKFPGINVRITETTRMMAVLKVTAVQQQITVQAEVATVETASPTTGQALSNETITSLPLASRNFQTLLSLSAGATSDLYGASQLGRGNVYIHVNGGREDNNNYLIEGITASDYTLGELNNTPLPNPDAIQEFKVSTSLYDATQGRDGGGNINAILKSGTSSYHFDAWEYFRNTVLDANDWFQKQAGRQRPIIKQNQFGGDAGGPVDPGKKFGFFYVNYQGTRQRSGASAGTSINTQIPVLPPVRDQATLIADLFNGPNCQGLPPGVTTLDSVALKLLQSTKSVNQFGGGGGFLIPTVPGTPGCTVLPSGQTVLNTGPLVISSPGKFTEDQFTANWDKEFHGARDRISERFFWSNSETFQPFGADSYQLQTGGVALANNLNFPLDTPLHGRFGSIAETHIFSNALVNEFRFGVNIISTKFNNVPILTASDLGINRSTNNGTDDIYRLVFGSFSIGSYPTQIQYSLSDTFIWLDTLSWTHGPHTFRFGGEINRTTIRRGLPVADNGLVFFTPPEFTNLTDFQNFLIGAVSSAQGGGGTPNHDYRIPSFSVFAQDDYRVTKTLTLNLGLRTEFLAAPYDELCHLGNTNPELANANGQPFFWPSCVNKFNVPGLVGTASRSTLLNNWATVLEPRIGVAYDLFGHHTTAIRAGYGIYSVREDLGAVDNLSFTAPFFPIAVPVFTPPGTLNCLFFVAQNCANAPLMPPLGQFGALPQPSVITAPAFPANCTLGNGAPGVGQQCGPNFSGSVISLFGLVVPLHWIVPTTQQWNLTLQRELGKLWFIEIGYVGTKGTHLRSTYDPGQARLVLPNDPTTWITVPVAGGAPVTIKDSTLENANARAPFLGLSPFAFEAFAPVSDSHYNGLQLTVAHHYSNGLYFQGAYTYANSIDNTSNATVAFDSRINDQTNSRASRGLSDFNRRHRFVASGVYELPFFKSSQGLTKQALGNWEISGVLTLQSGLPFTVFDSAGGSAFALSTTGIVTPTFAPGFSCANAASPGGTEARLAHWVNPNAYVPDPAVPLSTGGFSDATVFGNAPRNCIIGPPQKNLDFTIGKSFRLTERQSLRFRADFFNFTNHPSFANPSATDIENPSSFAAISSVVGTPRLIQFSLKWSY